MYYIYIYMEPLKNCVACGKPLRGRADKKFCDDYCRNNYNNRQNSDQSNFVRNVNNILRRNRRILETLIPEGEELKKIAREKLLQEGFNFKYHTHLFSNQKGQTYYFNYEYGYLILEGDWVLVVKRKAE
jgi:predicted nucleic acid-binding Zn ribbon protein